MGKKTRAKNNKMTDDDGLKVTATIGKPKATVMQKDIPGVDPHGNTVYGVHVDQVKKAKKQKRVTGKKKQKLEAKREREEGYEGRVESKLEKEAKTKLIKDKAKHFWQ